MDNASARNMWGDFLDTHLEYAFADEPRVTHFGDNEADCQNSLKRVLSGNKRATSHSLLGLQLRKERLPKIGDFTVVTDWNGRAQGIVRTVGVRLKPYFSIRESYAKMDGDASLDSWKQYHWEFYKRELAPYSREPRESMIVVCEIFEKVYPV